MKRIGFIGLSTPSFYNYKHMATRVPGDISSSPNPVIEGAFGSMLLYDELWFLCRSLCPENMRSLSYVKFMDEEQTLPDVDPEWIPSKESAFSSEALDQFANSFKIYNEVKMQAHIYWDAGADIHTHELRIGKYHLTGNSCHVESVLYDMTVLNRLPNNVELLTNSFTSALFDSEARISKKALITESLVFDSVPQFLTPKGPYHPCIEEVRNSDYLSYYREWVTTEAFKAGCKDIAAIKRETEAKLAESQKKVFLKHLDPKRSYMSIGKTVLTTGIDSIIPLLGSAANAVNDFAEEKGKKRIRWQGFILDTRDKVKNTKGL